MSPRRLSDDAVVALELAVVVLVLRPADRVFLPNVSVGDVVEEHVHLADGPCCVFAVPVNTSGAAFESGIPERLLALLNSGADVTADGQRFLIAAPTAQRSVPPVITVVLNWPALVSK